MKVKAIAMGYHNNVRVRPGTVFEMDESKFKKDEKGQAVMPKWLVPADFVSKKKALKLPGAKVVKKPGSDDPVGGSSTGDSDVI